jgi:SapC
VTNVVHLNTHVHRDLKVQSRASARLGDAQRFVAVIVNEVPFLVPHYPVFFAKDSDTGRFFLGAMLGFDDGENLFLDETGQEPDSYRPLNFRRGPFWTVGEDLAIDLDSPRIGEGEALFDTDGNATPYLEAIKTTMRELKVGQERNRIFTDTLLELKLIEPIEMDIGFDDGTKRHITGLYTVAQETLRGLPDAQVLDLFRRGYLQIIDLMIGSIRQVHILAQKKNRRLRDGTEALGAAPL